MPRKTLALGNLAWMREGISVIFCRRVLNLFGPRILSFFSMPASLKPRVVVINLMWVQGLGMLCRTL